MMTDRRALADRVSAPPATLAVAARGQRRDMLVGAAGFEPAALAYKASRHQPSCLRICRCLSMDIGICPVAAVRCAGVGLLQGLTPFPARAWLTTRPRSPRQADAPGEGHGALLQARSELSTIMIRIQRQGIGSDVGDRCHGSTSTPSPRREVCVADCAVRPETNWTR
jgi:hypothetical protein